MGSLTSIRMHFSNRCRGSGMRSVPPRIRLPQRRLAAENIRFQGPPLIRLRRRNWRPQMLTLLITRSPLAMTSTRLSKTKRRGWKLVFVAQTDYLKHFEIYTLYNPAILLFCTCSYHAGREHSEYGQIVCTLYSKKKISCALLNSTYDGCINIVNDATSLWCNCQSILDTLTAERTNPHQITRQ
jgi:hypothetical protein